MLSLSLYFDRKAKLHTLTVNLYLLQIVQPAVLMAVNYLLSFSSFVFGMAGHISGKSIPPPQCRIHSLLFFYSFPIIFRHMIETGICMEAYMFIHHSPYTYWGAASDLLTLHSLSHSLALVCAVNGDRVRLLYLTFKHRKCQFVLCVIL